MGKTRDTGYLTDVVVVNGGNNVTLPAVLNVTNNVVLNNVFNRQTASYSIVLADAGKIVEMNVATANNLTVPLNSTQGFAIGAEINVIQYGAGQTTFVATSGVTIRSSSSALKLTGQYSGATLIKVGTDEWYLIGNITT